MRRILSIMAVSALALMFSNVGSHAQVGGTPGGGPAGPGPVGGPLGGGYTPEVMKGVREIIQQGKTDGWSKARIKATVNAYLVSKGYAPIP